MANDPFSSQTDGASEPSRQPFAVTPSDSAELPLLPKALYVGTAGHVALRGADATADVVFRNVPAGSIIDVRASFVRATGTTAADIVGLA